MIETYRISYSTRAKQDLRDIYTYIALSLKEKQTAGNISQRIRKEICSLNTFPERCPKVDWEPWASMDIRKLSVGNHVVYYQTDLQKKTVTVIRIFYGGRNVENIINTGID